MATSPIGYTSNSYGYYNKSAQDAQAVKASSSSSSDTSFGADIREKVAALLEDIPRNSNGTLTFDAVIQYRDEKLADFEAKAKADLQKLGVDTDRDMAFAYDAATDTLTVDSSHPDKKIIDQYFTEQDDLRHQFAQVVALNKMTGAAESKLSPTQMKAQLQVQAMSWWAEANTDDIFGGGNLLASAGGSSSFFGLNMVV